ncbi:hypothetical protein OUZ56_005864 [Daphnia magna]|uniref:Uncharacterized protein n=1 Tax=Daphnia magna TaxID=35525 RepID=A0ABQ9YVC8_9CRUS|nr:hypothetical protein OUZ56_005864 [Daphnia magna]
MASFICSMPSEDLSLKKVRSEELYMDLKKWLVFPRIGRHRFGSQISALSKNLGLLARGSHGLADDYDGLHCLHCVSFPGNLLGCIQRGYFFPTEFFELSWLCRGLEAVGMSNAK